ncbi:MAG: (E)-4-hydroxy-3-methylbut-2-enyl-diphosphate synthase [Treponema sp.]|jgi:(E)-4-hydroxy-3-methylbut-2-enyl-diphosphate synthase|nr:(E)-4-hydroxy-3-methylbut-2-enyl-diphosphate synthase [Treponema sp.]
MGFPGAVKIGGFDHVNAVTLGGGFPVVIQTMWKDRLSFENIRGEAGTALIRRIENLGRMGCGIIRFAVPDIKTAEVVGELASVLSMPLCADIHFDYKTALRCLDFPVAKLRINPGNIGNRNRVRAVAEKAAARGVPVRIGVNAGSLPRELRRAVEGGFDRAEALVKAAMDELSIFDELGFTGVVVSMKASGIADTIKANRLFARRREVPLHIGLTEAGPLISGTVRNSAALLPLLTEGAGDTLRVSLSDTPENEIIAGREILSAARDLGAKRGKPGAVIVSCPRCGRHNFDTLGFARRWKERFYTLDRDITVAVMGCAVNGPGEARHADLGITGAGNKVLIFAHGRIVRIVDAAEADKAFEEELIRVTETL